MKVTSAPAVGVRAEEESVVFVAIPVTVTLTGAEVLERKIPAKEV